MLSNKFTSRIQTPVKREGAEHYLLLTLLSFAGSVTLTRLFLELTGYPQVGGKSLHIAHVLWGGLLLFAASLLPLLFANRWVYNAGSILSGAGVGLFIDEVGKFITQNNNYFYPAAAPIIYAFFLLVVLLYVRVRRPPSLDSRAELYRALDGMEEVLDHDLSVQECNDLKARLAHAAAQPGNPELSRLAKVLLEFISSDEIHPAEDRPGVATRMAARLQTWEKRWLNRPRLRAILAGGLVALAILTMDEVFPILLGLFSPRYIEASVTSLVVTGQVTTAGGLVWFYARLALEVGVGLLLLVAAVQMAIGRDRQGALVGYWSLLMSLTMVDLLVFYFDQFAAIMTALIQFGLLMGVMHYRRLYLPRPASPEWAYLPHVLRDLLRGEH